MEKEYLMTIEGKKELEKRLAEIKSTEMPRVLEDIKTARAHGDLSENYEYTAAREQQEKLLLEIADIEDRLKFVKIIDERNLNSDIVTIGGVVSVFQVDLMYSPNDDPDEKVAVGKDAITARGFTAADVVRAYTDTFATFSAADAKAIAAEHGFTAAEVEASLAEKPKKDKKLEAALKLKYKIVGSQEASAEVKDGVRNISNESKVGKTFLGKHPGETFIVGNYMHTANGDVAVTAVDGVLFKIVGINEK